MAKPKARAKIEHLRVEAAGARVAAELLSSEARRHYHRSDPGLKYTLELLGEVQAVLKDINLFLQEEADLEEAADIRGIHNAKESRIRQSMEIMQGYLDELAEGKRLRRVQ